MFFGSMSFENIECASNTISKKAFVCLIMENMLKEDKSEEQLLELAKEDKILRGNENKLLKEPLTQEMAAVYLYRADAFFNGQDFDEKMFEYVKNQKRISDLKLVKKSNRASIIKIFCKGIMVGVSDGAYTHTRKFQPSLKVKKKDAQLYINRLMDAKLRIKMSPDGQVIRTTNLPKNAKRYAYILESFPNAYYEPKFIFEKTKYWSKPVSLVDYAYPKDIGKMKFDYNKQSMQKAMDLYLDQWCENVRKNMELRFNVDYRTIGNSWIKKLRNTYYVFEDDASSNRKQTEDIKKYVKKMKENKVVVKAETVSVERSSLYFDIEVYLRVYVKYKVVKCKRLRNQLYIVIHLSLKKKKLTVGVKNTLILG